jgi:signal transduction histidine kinase
MRKPPSATRSNLVTGLSARLLLLTIFFVMLSEVLIYVPSIARYRLVYLEGRLDAARIATLAMSAAPENMVSANLEAELLASVQARSVILRRHDLRALFLSEPMPFKVDTTFDLRETTAYSLIVDAFNALRWRGVGNGPDGDRVIRVVGELPPGDSDRYLEVVLNEGPLIDEMYDFSVRILSLSIVISLITAGLVFFSLQWLMVRPVQRITESMAEFRDNPESSESMISPSERSDEIGIAQRALATMQQDLRASLAQKSRLAALGAAVSKVNHDLRNILASTQLVSQRLADSSDPTVRRLTPRLYKSIDRAITLCTETLDFGRAGERLPRRVLFPLDTLIPDLRSTVGVTSEERAVLIDDIAPGLELDGDPEQIFRVLLNLIQNAVQALAAGGGGEVRIAALREEDTVTIDVRDSGPGIPKDVQANLFDIFGSSGREGGTGLGLAIARDLVKVHGGDIRLMESDSSGTWFRVEIPDR